MKVQRFVHGPQVVLNQLVGGDLFFLDPNSNDIQMVLQGIAQPDENTMLCCRVADGQVTGFGRGDVVNRCDAILEPLS